MTRILPHIVGALLGLLFVAVGAMFLLGMMPEQPKPPEGSPMALFMGAMAPSGYMAFIKVCEVLGGLLTMVPKTRNLGLLVLGPIIVNILAFHVFITGGQGLAEPMVVFVAVAGLFLLYSEREAFAGLVQRVRPGSQGD